MDRDACRETGILLSMATTVVCLSPRVWVRVALRRAVTSELHYLWDKFGEAPQQDVCTAGSAAGCEGARTSRPSIGAATHYTHDRDWAVSVKQMAKRRRMCKQRQLMPWQLHKQTLIDEAAGASCSPLH